MQTVLKVPLVTSYVACNRLVLGATVRFFGSLSDRIGEDHDGGNLLAALLYVPSTTQ